MLDDERDGDPDCDGERDAEGASVALGDTLAERDTVTDADSERDCCGLDDVLGQSVADDDGESAPQRPISDSNTSKRCEPPRGGARGAPPLLRVIGEGRTGKREKANAAASLKNSDD